MNKEIEDKKGERTFNEWKYAIHAPWFVIGTIVWFLILLTGFIFVYVIGR